MYNQVQATTRQNKRKTIKNKFRDTKQVVFKISIFYIYSLIGHHFNMHNYVVSTDLFITRCSFLQLLLNVQ